MGSGHCGNIAGMIPDLPRASEERGVKATSSPGAGGAQGTRALLRDKIPNVVFGGFLSALSLH